MAYGLFSEILSYKIQSFILLITVGTIGIPHGFFDFSIAKKLYGKHKYWLRLFTTIYTAIAICYCFAWMFFPQLSLTIFIFISAYHFGIEEIPDKKDSPMTHVAALVIGSTPILFPVIVHTDAVLSIFGVLINSDIDLLITFQDHHFAIYFGLVLASLYVLGRTVAFSYLILIPNFILLPPLLSFVLYFCFHHSLKHHIESIFEEQLIPPHFSTAQFLKLIVGASIVFSCLALFVMYQTTDLRIDNMMTKYIFVILACLTLPHLLLHLHFDLRSKENVLNNSSKKKLSLG